MLLIAAGIVVFLFVCFIFSGVFAGTAVATSKKIKCEVCGSTVIMLMKGEDCPGCKTRYVKTENGIVRADSLRPPM